MRIVRLSIRLIDLRLKRKIVHATASRSETTNLLVQCILADGTEGWGEGVPRDYITGETPQSAMVQLRHTPLAEQMDINCENWFDVIRLCQRIRPMGIDEDPRESRGNALKCAIELSILDAYGHLFGEPVSRIIECFEPAKSLRTKNPSVRYSGVITAGSSSQEKISALKIRAFGFEHCKVKVGIVKDELKRLEGIRRWIGNGMILRLDANEAWRANEVIPKLEPLLKLGIASIEQPVAHAEIQSLAEIRKVLDVPIMLDESLTGLPDALAAIRDQTCDLFNLRLSKCGGYLECLKLAALAKENGLGYQLGCHPGESGILSAAGRHWASTVRNIQFLEGSYDHFILKEGLTRENMTFKFGGWARSLSGPGLGVSVNLKSLKRVAREPIVIELAE